MSPVCEWCVSDLFSWCLPPSLDQELCGQRCVSLLNIVSEGCVSALHTVGAQPMVKEGREECVAAGELAVWLSLTQPGPVPMPHFVTGCGDCNSGNRLISSAPHLLPPSPYV